MKSLKLYLASSFDYAEKCNNTAKFLIERGHQIPDIWWNVRTKDEFVESSEIEFYGHYLVQSIALRHWKTIDSCDAVILVSDSNKNRFTGANVEVGYAIGKGIPVFSLGPIKRSAMYVPVIKCLTLQELEKSLNCLAGQKR